jgi:WD40-like Beta Propeller Repeat
MKTYILFFIAILIGGNVSCQSVPSIFNNIPDSVAEVFQPNFISLTNRYEISISFSSYVEEIFYTVQYPNEKMKIFSRKLKNNKWSEEYELDLLVDSENSYAMEPFPSPKNDNLYFTVCDSVGCDIWFVEKMNDQWQNSTKLDSDLNNDIVFYSTFNQNGDMFYTNVSKMKTYLATFQNSKYSKFEIAGIGGAHAFPSPDGKYVLVNSKGEFGKSDIFVFFKEENNTWSKPINLGEKINTNCSESCPSLSPDGKILFFNRHCEENNDSYDIFWINSRFIYNLEPQD